MEQTISIENRIKEIFADDPLYLVIKETPTEQLFLSEPYLSNLIEKNSIPHTKWPAGLMSLMHRYVTILNRLKSISLMMRPQILLPHPLSV